MYNRQKNPIGLQETILKILENVRDNNIKTINLNNKKPIFLVHTTLLHVYNHILSQHYTHPYSTY